MQRHVLYVRKQTKTNDNAVMRKKDKHEFDKANSQQYYLNMTLFELTCGSGGVISKVDGHGVLRDRLLDMGLTPGTEVFLRKTAPMGDPIEITLRGYELTLRKEDAKMIQLKNIRDGYHLSGDCDENCASCKK